MKEVPVIRDVARLRSPPSQESRFSSLMILITSTLITLREKLRNGLES